MDYENDKFNTLDEYFTPYAFNPYYALNENQTSFFENRFYGNISIDAKITDWFKATYRIGADASSADVKDYEAIMRFTPGSTSNLKNVTENPGRVYEQNVTNSLVNQDILLSLNKNFGDFSLSGLLGFSTFQEDYKRVSGSVSSLVIPYFYNLANTDGAKETSTYESQKRRYAYFADASVGYKDYAYLNVTGRQEYSSTLPIDANNFFYPSVSLSVLADKMIPSLAQYFDLLKVRTSWGQAGNDAPVYRINSIMSAASVAEPYSFLLFPLAGVGAYEVNNTIGNPTLQPEITTEFEVGTEMHILKSRVIIDFSYYNKVSDKQILVSAIAASSGYSGQVINFGKIENKGIELLATVYPVKNANLSWGLTVNFTKNKNTVLELPDDAPEYIFGGLYGVEMYAKVGQPLGILRAFDYLYDSYEADGVTPSAGAHVIVNATSGIPLGTDYKTDIGNIQPDYILGVTNSISYKNFDLSFTFDYRPGGLMYSGTGDLNYFVGNATLTTFNNRQPFLIPNSVIENPNYDETIVGSPEYIENDVPITMTNINAYYYHSSNPVANRDRVISRDYFKLRDLSLSYNVPSKFVKLVKLSGVQLVLSGRNLLLYTPADNNFVDPEATSFGNDIIGEMGEFRTSPTVRSFTGSIRIKF
jgi:outer membrane receptor protein involved in Fe transport